MASITLKGNAISTSGELPTVGSKAPDFEKSPERLHKLQAQTECDRTATQQSCYWFAQRRLGSVTR